jgi:hypothetical protein
MTNPANPSYQFNRREALPLMPAHLLLRRHDDARFSFSRFPGLGEPRSPARFALPQELLGRILRHAWKAAYANGWLDWNRGA